MTTLADKEILLGADNRPPILEKDMYDSWKSRMELYMINRQHGRMILDFVENGPLIWPSIEENRVTRPKKYSELSVDPVYNRLFVSLLKLLVTLDKSKTTKVETLTIMYIYTMRNLVYILKKNNKINTKDSSQLQYIATN
ncbi:hypothetical protein Tco_0653892 [Tanacetum coccineum]|uniref:Integrase, catalytic region, zinc finger, CCHC-type, peptidase aspartic, catalytic n=1 Tax=Tanacetum coccineum TaxID=301880 RepID=A0ABQ4X243_9ASTR